MYNIDDKKPLIKWIHDKVINNKQNNDKIIITYITKYSYT